MKTSLIFPVIAAMHLSVSAETLYPVYTVTTSGNAIVTNQLEECDVSIVDSEGAEPRTVPFSELDKSAGVFSGTFVIDAASYLMGSVAMTNFTGEIRIRRGALIVDAVGWLGVANKNDAPKLYVENGASLVPTCPVVRGCKIYNELHLSGEGYNGIGAFCNRYRAAHNDYCFYNDIYLEDDAMIGMWTQSRIDMYRGSCTMYLQDHTLTVKDFTSNGNSTFCTYSARIEFGTGRILVDGGKILVQDSNNNPWTFEPGASLELLDGASFGFYRSSMKIPVPMTISGKSVAMTGSGSLSFPGSVSSDCYMGDIRLDRSLSVRNGSVTLSGDISGKGGIEVSSNLLRLTGTNTHEGPISASGGQKTCVAFWHKDALSPNASSISITDPASLRMVVDERDTGTEKQYDIPALSYHVDEGNSFSLGVNTMNVAEISETVTGGADGRIASLKKTGSGELELLANYSITGRTEVLGGVLRLAPASPYSAVPGLWEGVVLTNEAGKAEALEQGLSVGKLDIYKFYTSRACLSNRVVSSAYLFGKRNAPFWETFMVTTYSGYIWNRTGTDQTVTLVGSIIDAWRIYVNGRQVCALYDAENLKKGTVTLKPGANPFEVRGWCWKREDGGCMIPKKMPTWALGMGLAMAYGETDDQYDPEDYFVPQNGPAACPGGDGFLFTRDSRAPEDFTAEELATTRTAISNLCMAAGSTIDLSGTPLFVETFEGVGNVINGDLTVKDKWAISYSDIVAGVPLNVSGKLNFREGAVVELDHEDARPQNRPDGGFVVVSASGGIEGAPSLVCGKVNWMIKVSDDRKSLCAVYRPTGMSVVIR